MHCSFMNGQTNTATTWCVRAQDLADPHHTALSDMEKLVATRKPFMFNV
jgi:hypothetical protein